MTTVDHKRWAASWLNSLMRRDYNKEVSVYIRRRRAWLWRPALVTGAALLAWQITSDIPTPALVYTGMLLCLPWVVDC